MAMEVSDWVPAGSSPSSRHAGSTLQSGSPPSSSSWSSDWMGPTPGGWFTAFVEPDADRGAAVARAGPGTGFVEGIASCIVTPPRARMRATTAAARFPMFDMPERATPARARAAGGRSASATEEMPSDATSSIPATEPILCMSPPSSTGSPAGLLPRRSLGLGAVASYTFRGTEVGRFRTLERSTFVSGVSHWPRDRSRRVAVRRAADSAARGCSRRAAQCADGLQRARRVTLGDEMRRVGHANEARAVDDEGRPAVEHAERLRDSEGPANLPARVAEEQVVQVLLAGERLV